jgi:hypothetical protein
LYLDLFLYLANRVKRKDKRDNCRCKRRPRGYSIVNGAQDREFAASWDQAHEQAVDAVESSLYQKALGGDTICMIFYLKAHRPIYRNKLNIDVQQLHSEIEDRLAELREAGIDLIARAMPALTDGEITPMPGRRSLNQ